MGHGIVFEHRVKVGLSLISNFASLTIPKLEKVSRAVTSVRYQHISRGSLEWFKLIFYVTKIIEGHIEKIIFLCEERQYFSYLLRWLLDIFATTEMK